MPQPTDPLQASVRVRRALTCCVLLLSLGSTRALAAEPNVLVNGGFETGSFTGWTPVAISGSGGMGGFGIASPGLGGGFDGYYWYARAGQGAQAYVEQQVFLLPGRQYRLTAKAASISGGINGDGGNLTVFMDGLKLGSVAFGGVGIGTTYGSIDTTVTPGQISNALRFAITRGGGADGGTPATCGDNFILSPVADAAALGKVLHMSPAPGTAVGHGTGSIRVHVSEALDPATLIATNLSLQRSGGDGTFTDGNEVVITPTSITAPTPFTILIGIDAITQPDDRYRLTIGSNVATATGHALDGEFSGAFPSGDGTAGGSFASEFIISEAPTVTSTSPASGATGVTTSSTVAVTFSKAMDQASAEAAFSIIPTVSGSFSWSGNTMTFQPAAALAADTMYTVGLSADAVDPLATPLVAHDLVFTTGASLPGTALPGGNVANLLHLGTTAADRITGYPVSGISVLWDNFLYAGHAPEHLQQPEAGTTFAAQVTASENPLVWTALNMPSGQWSAQSGGFTQYYALYVIAPTGRSTALSFSNTGGCRAWLDGEPVAVMTETGGNPTPPFWLSAGVHAFVFKHTNSSGSGQFSVKFVTPGGADQTDLRYTMSDLIAPRVSSVGTWNDDNAVPLWSDILITFTEPMDTTVAASSVVSLSGGSGTWSWTDEYHLCWTPTALLAPGTTYTITFGAVTDRNGNGLAGQGVFSFSTVTSLSSPTLASVNPPTAQVGVPLHNLTLSGSGFIQGGIIHAPGALPFGGHLYRFYGAPGTNWTAARNACIALGGHLATVSSQSEDSFVWNAGGRINGWLGMSAPTPSGTYSWSTGESMGYTNWAQNEPSGDFQELYGIYWWGFQWNNVPSDPATYRPYVCEFDRRTTPEVRLQRSGSPDFIASNVTFTASTDLATSFDLTGATEGTYDVLVTNPDGSQTLLENAVTVVNARPVAADGTLAATVAVAKAGTLSASDVNNDPMTFAIVSGPLHGTITGLNATTGAYTYTSAAGYAGSDLFTFTASDAGGASNVATITVTVTDVTNPSVTITDPAPSSVTRPITTAMTINGVASDNVGLASVSYTLTGVTTASGPLTLSGSDWTLTTPTLNVGVSTLVVTAQDLAGRTSTDTLTIRVDQTAPSVLIVSPTTAPTYDTGQSIVTISGTASDNHQVASVAYTLSGATIASGAASFSGGSWSIAPTLNAGVTTATITAVDVAGNGASDTITITMTPGFVDETDPLVSITSPSSATVARGTTAPYAISGTASDNVGVTSLSYTLSGATTASGSLTLTDGNWSLTTPALNVGATTVVITASDQAGNTATDSLQIEVDTTSPAIQITSPTVGNTYDTGSATVAMGGTVSDNLAIDNVTWTLTGATTGTGAATFGGGTWSTMHTLNAGITTVTMTATDTAGNQASDSLSITMTPGFVDITDPAVAITSPASASVVRGTTAPYTISGTASDNVTVVAITYALSGATAGSGSGTIDGTTWSLTTPTLEAGSTTLVVTASDLAGNTATDTLQITIDTTAPAIEIITPTSAPAYETGQTVITVSGTASDNLAVANVGYSLSGATSGSGMATFSSGTWSIAPTLNPGITTISVTVVDSAGNGTTDSISVTMTPGYDDSDPVVTITTPAGATVVRATTSPYTISGTASDNVGIVTITYALSGATTATGALTLTGSDWTLVTPTLGPGQTTVVITAEDLAGNSATDSVLVIVDTTVPEIEIVSPTTSSTHSTTSTLLTLSGTASDNLALSGVAYTLSGATVASGAATFGGGTWSTAPTLNIGVTVVTITAVDTAGNSSSDTVTVTLTTGSGGGGGGGGGGGRCGAGGGVAAFTLLLLAMFLVDSRNRRRR